MLLDAVDYKILAQLQEDSSVTNVELARRVHLSPSPCLQRVKALEAAGVIQRYVALTQPQKPEQGGAGRVRAAHRRARRGDGVLFDDRRL